MLHLLPRASSSRWISILAGAVLLSASLPRSAPPALAEEEPDAAGVLESVPGRVLRLATLPLPRGTGVAGPLAPEPELVPEFDVLRARPVVGEAYRLQPGRPVSWREVPLSETLPAGPGVVWLAAYPRIERYGEYEISLEAPGSLALYLDGILLAEFDGADPQERDEPHEIDEGDEDEGDQDEGDEEFEDAGEVEHTLTLHRGRYCLLARIESAEESGPSGIELEIEGRYADSIEWSTDPELAPARFDQTRGVTRVTGLALSPRGLHVARRLTRREAQGEEERELLQVLARTGTVEMSLGEGETGDPLFFTPRSRELVLRRDEEILVWPLTQGSPRVLVREEKDLSLVEPNSGASFLLLVSRRGAELPEEDPEAVFHQSELRRTVPDYLPGDCLHLVEVETGARRQLTRPGDHMIDDAIFLPQSQSVLYARIQPQAERPWFRSEIRRIALDTGDESLVCSFTAGWEVRPDDLCISPDGLRAAFTGPPEPVGGGHAEHNVYNRALWVLDLISGEYQRVISEEGWSYNAAHDLGVLSWMDDSTLVAVVDAGSGHAIVRLLEGPDGWRLRELPYEGEFLDRAALAPDLSFLVYGVESRDRAPSLRVMDLKQERELPLEDPNENLPWKLAAPQDASFKGPGGETIEGWWYAPTAGPPPPADAGTGDRTPLIVYYYGGASPTDRGFNPTHQWISANGYALLVLQARGAFGWGDAFADHHAGDWGPDAGADLLAGVESFLKAHPEVDAQRVGIWGGSYGGYMTDWLLTRSKRFAAAVSYYGISDVASYWGTGEWGWTYGDMSVAGRTPFEDPKYFAERAPWRQAEKITTPLLLMHGMDDRNVRPEESVQMFTALRVQGKPVELVLFPGEEHGIGGSFANRCLQRQMMMDWFDRWLRDQPEAWNARWWEEK